MKANSFNILIISLLLILFCFPHICCGQTFKSEKAKISYKYPQGFEDAVKWTSGDIIMKIKDYKGHIITMSYHLVNAPENLSSWDDEFYSVMLYNANQNKIEENIKIEKTTVNTRSGLKKCVFWVHKNKNYGFTTFDFLFLHHGQMIGLSFMVENWNGDISNIANNKKVTEGLSFW